MSNILDTLEAKVDALTLDVRRALERTQTPPPKDELGGLELARSVTGLARRTIYKLTHQRAIPHRRKGGRLYFRRTELEEWIDSGLRKTAREEAVERMAEVKHRGQGQKDQPEETM